MYTFNEINKAFNDIAVAHKQINTYGIGDIWEIATSGTVLYPLMWAKPENSSLEKNTYVSSFSLIFMDLVHKDERNEKDVISDMELVALDVIALLKNPSYEFDFKAENISFERFTENFLDYVAGVIVNINLRIPYTADRCAVPSTTISVGDGSNFVQIINAITGAVIAQISAPGSYPVYQWSGIDEGSATTTYTDGITDQ